MEMAMEMSVDDQSTEVEMTTRFSDYGEPVNVTIPEEATAGSGDFAAAGVAA